MHCLRYKDLIERHPLLLTHPQCYQSASEWETTIRSHSSWININCYCSQVYLQAHRNGAWNESRIDSSSTSIGDGATHGFTQWITASRGRIHESVTMAYQHAIGVTVSRWYRVSGTKVTNSPTINGLTGFEQVFQKHD